MQNSRIKMIVVQDTLSYVFPEEPMFAHVLMLGLDSPYKGGEKFSLEDQECRLAGREDFDYFGVGIEQYQNGEYELATEAEYLPQTKATILLENDFGIVIQRHVRLRKVWFHKENGSFYTQRLTAKYVAKGKRKVTGCRFHKAVIAKGWQNVDGAIVGGMTNAEDFFNDTNFGQAEAGLKNIIWHSEKDAPKPFIIKQ